MVRILAVRNTQGWPVSLEAWEITFAQLITGLKSFTIVISKENSFFLKKNTCLCSFFPSMTLVEKGSKLAVRNIVQHTRRLSILGDFPFPNFNAPSVLFEYDDT